MSGFICMPNRALHDYTWNVCGFFIICIRWLLFAFLFLLSNLYTLYHLSFCHKGSVLRLSKSGGCLENGCGEMFYCSFQKSVALCWMSAWMKITLKERGILAWDRFPQKSGKFDRYLGSTWTVQKNICHDDYSDFINLLFWSPNILLPKKPF